MFCLDVLVNGQIRYDYNWISDEILNMYKLTNRGVLIWFEISFV